MKNNGPDEHYVYRTISDPPNAGRGAASIVATSRRYCEPVVERALARSAAPAATPAWRALVPPGGGAGGAGRAGAGAGRAVLDRAWSRAVRAADGLRRGA